VKKKLVIFSVLTVIIVGMLFLFPLQISALPSEPPLGGPGEGLVHLSVDPKVSGEETEFYLEFDEPLLGTGFRITNFVDNIVLDYYFSIFKFHGTWEELMSMGPDVEDLIIYDKIDTVHPPDEIEISKDLSEGHYFGFLIVLPLDTLNLNLNINEELYNGIGTIINWDKVEFNIEDVWVRTQEMTCKQVWVNEDNMFQFSFIYPYADNNWVRIYDMAGNMVYEIDMPYDNPNIIVDLPNGTYTVKTFTAGSTEPIQTFVIGK
jgi:hypothetical protein